jgi:hypothetical protein
MNSQVPQQEIYDQMSNYQLLNENHITMLLDSKVKCFSDGKLSVCQLDVLSFWQQTFKGFLGSELCETLCTWQ